MPDCEESSFFADIMWAVLKPVLQRIFHYGFYESYNSTIVAYYTTIGALIVTIVEETPTHIVPSSRGAAYDGVLV